MEVTRSNRNEHPRRSTSTDRSPAFSEKAGLLFEKNRASARHSMLEIMYFWQPPETESRPIYAIRKSPPQEGKEPARGISDSPQAGQDLQRKSVVSITAFRTLSRPSKLVIARNLNRIELPTAS
jgi:hypothetical protein